MALRTQCSERTRVESIFFDGLTTFRHSRSCSIALEDPSEAQCHG